MANKNLPDIISNPDTKILTGRGSEGKKDLLGDYPVEYCNKDNPDSIQQKAPIDFSNALDTHEIWMLLVNNDEFDLQKKVKPTAEQNRLRLAFWREYERSIQVKEQMDVVNVYKGIMSKENFERLLKMEPRVVAWILKQPTNYVNMMEESLSFSMHRVREILEMPIYKKVLERTVMKNSGEVREISRRVPNVPVCKLILDTMKLLDLRVKGAVVQTVKQHIKTDSTNRNLTANFNVSSTDQTPKSLKDIDAQIAQLTAGLDNINLDDLEDLDDE